MTQEAPNHFGFKKKIEPREPRDFLPLSQTAWYVLVPLLKGQNHGYAIMKEARRLSGGSVDLGVGSMYTSMHRYEENGFISRSAMPDAVVQVGDMLDSETTPVQARTMRRPFELTELGRKVLETEEQGLRIMLTAGRKKGMPSSAHRGPRTKVYRLTDFGRQVYDAQHHRISVMIQALETVRDEIRHRETSHKQKIEEQRPI